MAEQTQIQVTKKDPKMVEAGKRLAEHNCRKKKEHVQVAKLRVSPILLIMVLEPL